ncbi:hypothetical protein DM02DRAFT_228235 [Periconia macrospinosa]|uniref:G-patch domain-containing protein n=1 Tax=Periconia macrospinosa TaxID=97972 RepID=A0A2V1D5T2_9PLEO|nr:hypothetical protein DM02DRAFT_228235 [Periconia macrospinosa]
MAAERAATTATAIVEQRTLEYYQSTVDDDAYTLEAKKQEERAQKERAKAEKNLAKTHGEWYPSQPYRASKPSNLSYYRATPAYEELMQSFDLFLLQQRPASSSKDSSSQSEGSRPTSSGSSKTVESNYAEIKSSASAIPVIEAATGEDAFARRAQLAAAGPQAPSTTPPPPPPMTTPTYSATISAPFVPNPNFAPPASQSGPPVTNTANRLSEDERPVKKAKTTNAAPLSKAESMMLKMGYKKGQGLGKDNDGIVKALEPKERKDGPKQKGFKFNPTGDAKSKAPQVYDIKGGHTKKRKVENPMGEDSSVIVAWGCVDGVDWAADAERSDGGIMQDMADVFNPKFGKVLRFHINKNGEGQPVYMKFEGVYGAMNAINRFNEGFLFQGRNIKARFYPEKKFDMQSWEY